MRRLLRILVKIATALSALLCVAGVTLWLRSYWVLDDVSWVAGRLGYSINAQRGGVFYIVDEQFWNYGGRAPAYGVYPLTPPQPPNPDERLGFLHYHTGGGIIYVPQSDVTRVPLYPVVLMSAILPALGCVRLRRSWRRRSRLRTGLCPACGYDLRVTHDRCPECGTPVAAG